MTEHLKNATIIAVVLALSVAFSGIAAVGMATREDESFGGNADTAERTIPTSATIDRINVSEENRTKADNMAKEGARKHKTPATQSTSKYNDKETVQQDNRTNRSGSVETTAVGTQSHANDEYEPNDARENATPVSEGTYSDLQIVDDESDYFAITLDERDSIEASIEFAHTQSDLDLQLYGPDGGVPMVESASITDGESVSVAGVESGTYYVRVYSYNGESAPYDLNVTLSTAPPDDRYEPNDARETATSVSEGTYSDLQMFSLDEDYFAIILDERDSIDASIDFAHSEGDLDMALYGPDGRVLDGSYSITDDELVS